jgi:hypothetical protein
MLDLINSTEENHYEAYRLAQMETRKFGEPKVKKIDNPKFREEEEMLRKRFTEQVKLEESRFRQWEQHVRSILPCHSDIGRFSGRGRRLAKAGYQAEYAAMIMADTIAHHGT